MTVRIGITGPIGCGKSTVAGWLRELGAVIIDADAIARDVVRIGEPAGEAVLESFGEQARAADGGIDRAALASIVFNDPAALARLEAIVHPAVRLRIMEALAAGERDGEGALVIEAIKLVEGGLAALCDAVWLVTCDPATQQDRLAARGMGSAEAEARITSQGLIRERLAPFATVVIDTRGTPAETRVRVEAAYRAALGAS